MKRKYAPIGLLALGTIGWAPQQASALPNGLPHADHLSDVEQVRWFATRGDGLVAAELLPLVRLLSGSALCPSAFRLAHRGHSRSRQRWLKSHHHRRVFGDTSVTETWLRSTPFPDCHHAPTNSEDHFRDNEDQVPLWCRTSTNPQNARVRTGDTHHVQSAVRRTDLGLAARSLVLNL